MKRSSWARAAALSAFICGLVATTSLAQNDVAYSYDALGRLSSVCHTASGDFVAYQYDAAGNRSVVASTANGCSPASFTINNATAVAEGSSLSFAIARAGGLAFTHAVNYAAANGTATAGSDYTAASGTLTFTAGQTSKTVTVATINDTVYENNETVLVNLSAATNGATIADTQGVGTINNDDAAPTFAISDASATAGSALSFTVTKTGSTALSHAVNFATANGTAIAGTHYTAASGALTFTSGQTSQAVSVSTIAGSVPSGSKSMVVNLSGSTNGATILDSQGAGTINAPPANSPPVAVDDFVSGQFAKFSSVSVFVLTNDSDANGDPLTVTAASCISTGCSVSIVSGTYLSVTGTTVGDKLVGYSISDGRGGTASATATVGTFEAMCGNEFC